MKKYLLYIPNHIASDSLGYVEFPTEKAMLYWQEEHLRTKIREAAIRGIKTNYLKPMTKEAKIHKKKLEVEAMKVIFKHKDTLYWNFDFDKFKKGIVKLFEEFKGKSL